MSQKGLNRPTLTHLCTWRAEVWMNFQSTFTAIRIQVLSAEGLTL